MTQHLGMKIMPRAGYSHAANLMTTHPTADRTPHPAEHIRWRSVNSSNVVRVGWDSDMRLYAEFNNGGIYMYEGVSRQRAVACTRSKSVGQYFNKIIKPNYKAVKIA